MRRIFDVEEPVSRLWLEQYHDVELAKVYLNGRLIAEIEGRSGRLYGHRKVRMNSDALRSGTNVLAVEATKTRGRRGIDVGLYGVVAVAEELRR